MLLKRMNRPLRLWLLALNSLLLLPKALVQGQNYTRFNFTSFTSVDQLLIQRDAQYIPESSSIWLNPSFNGSTNGKNYSCGAVIYAQGVQMRHASTVASFTTSFTFSMTGSNSAGFTFMLSAKNSTTGGGAGASLCLLSKQLNGEATNHVFAVEFDTYQNPEFNDPSNNHVGVNVNSMNSIAVYDCEQGTTVCSRFVSGLDFTSWIDYDSATQQLQVFLAHGSTIQGVAKPANPIIQVPHLDLTNVVNDYMFVGFTGSGAMTREVKKIKSWSFNTGVIWKGANPSATQHGKSSVALIAGTLTAVIIAVVCTTFCVILRRGAKSGGDLERLSVELSSDAIEENNLLCPREFSFQELSLATNGFNEECLLGEGGFGQVFKGKLGTKFNDTLVAVKRTRIREHNNGSKEFLAELSVISQIRHRNLVQLYGWCHENNNFFLVLEYMPNSSMEKWLFNNEGETLTWQQRQHIMTGVAAALAYLHEGWDQCILHRDIKAANVLLDQNFDPHVSDFGLARLTDHNKTGRTTTVAGTFGYLAPETALEGKLTQKSDVFSFGILALEVASGRPVFRMNRIGEDEDEVNLLECVWDAHEREALLPMADPRVQPLMDPEEVKCMFMLGLLCCHPDPEARPVMRVVHQCMVDGKVAELVASLPSSKPRYQWCYGYSPSIGILRVQNSGGSDSRGICLASSSQGNSASQESSSGLTWSSSGSAKSMVL